MNKFSNYNMPALKHDDYHYQEDILKAELFSDILESTFTINYDGKFDNQFKLNIDYK